jgi:putative exosortase-associated protein (TIGR04073 family)
LFGPCGGKERRRTSMNRWIISLALLALCLSASPAAAQSAPRKLGRGLAAMTGSFLELPGNMVAETEARGPGEGMPLGFAKGLGMIVVRTLVGVHEFVTAPFPIPAGYRPIIEPEYPWGYFEDDRRTARADSHRRVRASRRPVRPS